MRKKTIEEVKTLIEEKIPGILLIEDSYKGIGELCDFIHPEYGPWRTRVSKILAGQGPRAGHADKVKKTIQEKYGVDCLMDVPGAKDKAKDTFRNKYGVDNPLLLKEIQDRCKKTLIERYGVNHPLKNQEIRERQAKSVQEYFDNNMDSFREKSRQTCLERYGVDNAAQSAETKLKIKSTLIKRYGVDHPMKCDEFKKKAFDSKVERGLDKRSGEELEVVEYLKSLGVDDLEHAYVNGVEVDVFSHSRRIGIEYNGLYSHSENAGKAYGYHLNKTVKCMERQIRLIHIWDYQWNNRNQQTKNFLKAAFGICDRRYGARVCDFREIDKVTSDAFLESTHIQGACFTSSYRVGIFFGEELISVASFGPHPRDRSSVTLDRFSCLDGVHVHGAMSKVSKMASQFFKKDMLTWAHRTLSEGDGYLKSGWIKEAVLQPDYFYAKRTGGVWEMVTKQSRRKSCVNTPEGMTEREHSIQDGLLRIWDCGKIRFRFPYISPSH